MEKLLSTCYFSRFVIYKMVLPKYLVSPAWKMKWVPVLIFVLIFILKVFIREIESEREREKERERAFLVRERELS